MDPSISNTTGAGEKKKRDRNSNNPNKWNQRSVSHAYSLDENNALLTIVPTKHPIFCNE